MHVPGDCRELVYEVTTEEFSSVSSGNSQTSWTNIFPENQISCHV